MTCYELVFLLLENSTSTTTTATIPGEFSLYIDMVVVKIGLRVTSRQVKVVGHALIRLYTVALSALKHPLNTSQLILLRRFHSHLVHTCYTSGVVINPHS